MSKFCDIDDYRLKNKRNKFHFAKDVNIKDKFQLWKEVFLNELIKRFIYWNNITNMF